MKRIYLAIIAAAAIFTGCSGGKSEATPQESEMVEIIAQSTNADSTQMYIDRAVAYADSLASFGKPAEAREFLRRVLAAVDTRRDASVTDYFRTSVIRLGLVHSIDSLRVVSTIDTVTVFIDETRDFAADQMDKAADRAREKASDAVETGRAVMNGAANTAERVINP